MAMMVVKGVTFKMYKSSVRILFPQQSMLRSPFSTELNGLLKDVNVLDLSRVIAGPFCTMTLGDLGANVIKVESLEGDEARKWGPPFIKDFSDSYYFLSVNRNKKSICIDLKHPDGKKIIHDLAKKCDVVVENFIPGKLDKLDVGYNKLSNINPQIIYCAITGFGPSGPYAKRPGYDVIASAMGGLLNVTGERNGNPVKAGVAITDVTTGLHAFGAIMTALYYRKTTGRGQKIDCNLFSTQISSMINMANIYLNCGIEGQRWGTAHANLVPYQAFKAKDGDIVIGTGSNAQFADFCKLIKREDLITDKRFKDNAARVENREIITSIISSVIVTKTKKEWTAIFKTATFPNGPVNSMREVFDDEHVKEIELVKELPHPKAGTIKVVGPPTVYSEGGNFARFAPPTLGQHTKESVERVAVITLKPARAASQKKVVWTDDTVDNEHMNKKKSKCCCIYEKPRRWDESDSETDDECENCFGHVERRHKHRHTTTTNNTTAATTVTTAATDEQQSTDSTVEKTVSITLQPQPAPPDRPTDN